MNWKRVYKFAVNNYFISIFIAVIIFVAFVSVFKLTFSKATYVYARLRVSQGLWWASGASKPNIGFVNAIKKGDVEYDLLGKPLAEVIQVRDYPGISTYENGYPFNNGFDIYLTLKLKTDQSKKTGKYNFKRSTLGVGSSVDLEFPKAQFSGNVTELSADPFADLYLEKTVTLEKTNAYLWEADGIKVGDKYFDGEDNTVEIVDKKVSENQTQYLTGGNVEQRKDITVKIKLKVKKIGGQLIYGEEQPVIVGKVLNLATQNFVFNEYFVINID